MKKYCFLLSLVSASHHHHGEVTVVTDRLRDEAARTAMSNFGIGFSDLVTFSVLTRGNDVMNCRLD